MPAGAGTPCRSGRQCPSAQKKVSAGSLPLQLSSHFRFLDLLKAVAAQLIVLHHLAFYGPMADQAQLIAPALFDWLDSHALIAVQVFLVVGGFLAAKALAPRGLPGVDDPLRIIARRFVKLVPPYLVAVGFAVAASALAGKWMTHDSISAAPTLGQLAAHALLLHSVLDYESLSAGIWYVAIDFQLYALLALLLWLAGRLAQGRSVPWAAPALVTLGMSSSLLYFNRDPAWDVWAPYFLGSYGLGVLAWWASDGARRPLGRALLLAAMLAQALAALAFDFRIRIAVALVTALMLVAAYRGGGRLFSNRRFALVGFLGRISYSVFLVHFPVCLIVNAAFARFSPPEPLLQAAGVLFAWAASVAAGALFYRWVEIPLGRLTGSARGSAIPARAS
jgi:peptidoglycan/LPS O-acetylase OafA/YrhL